MIKRKIQKRNPTPKIKNRFYTQKSDDGGYDLVDDKWGMVVNFRNNLQATESAKFARDYVRKWGDIDFSCFPYDLDTKLKYPDKEFFRGVNDKKWEGFELPKKSKKEQVIYTILEKNNVIYVYLKSILTNEKVTIPLTVINNELSLSYKNALIFAAERLGMDDYPNYNSAYNFFMKNKDKIIILKDNQIFSEIKNEYERLK